MPATSLTMTHTRHKIQRHPIRIRLRVLLALVIALMMGKVGQAQDDALDAIATPFAAIDSPTVPAYAPAPLNEPLLGTITDEAFFDWWTIQLAEGDEIVIEMYASNGLEPLLGLLDGNRDLVARSDLERIEPVNGLAVIQHTAELEGEYIIVPTRNENEAGTSTGNYRLEITLLRDDMSPQSQTPLEFRCSDIVANTALSIQFQEEIYEQVPNPDAPDEIVYEFFRLTVYGLDGFEPVIRAEASINATEPLDCGDDSQRIPGNTLQLSEGLDITFTEADSPTTAQLSLRNSNPDVAFGDIRFLVASKIGTGGRFVAVLEGLALQSPQDRDAISIRKGALARLYPLEVYMVGRHDSRLNPYMRLFDPSGNEVMACDDAGRMDCQQMDSLDGYGTQIALESGLLDLRADRFDAGVVMTDDALEIYSIALESNNRDTQGAYTLYFFGTIMPAQPLNDE